MKVFSNVFRFFFLENRVCGVLIIFDLVDFLIVELFYKLVGIIIYLLKVSILRFRVICLRL